MATISTEQFQTMKNLLRRDPVAWAQIRAIDIPRPKLKDALQAIEDSWQDNQISMKSDVDTAAGEVLTSTLAKKLAKAWMETKWKGE